MDLAQGLRCELLDLHEPYRTPVAKTLDSPLPLPDLDAEARTLNSAALFHELSSSGRSDNPAARPITSDKLGS